MFGKLRLTHRESVSTGSHKGPYVRVRGPRTKTTLTCTEWLLFESSFLEADLLFDLSHTFADLSSNRRAFMTESGFKDHPVLAGDAPWISKNRVRSSK
jgi:hypothetical protein